ncbi:MAG: protease pro-enzyme activation domain-containing protein [Verrucomicrobiota bacterium]
MRAVVVACVLSCFPIGAAAAIQTLHGHVPAAVQHLRPIGGLAPQDRLNLAISLPLRHTNELAQLIRDLYDPASPRFQHYLTAVEFAEQFGPTSADYQAVVAFAKANGFEIIGTHPNRTLLDVRAPGDTIERAFHVHLNRYGLPTEKRTIFSPDAEPSCDLTVPLLYVAGLSDYAKPRSMITRFKPDDSGLRGSPMGTGSAGNGGFMGKDFRTAYAPNVALTGAGQSIGLFELSAGYYPSDIAAYEAQAALPSVRITPVLLDGYDGSPGSWEVNLEVSLDIEMAISMAPGLDQVLVYEGLLPDSILNRMATDDIAKQLSASWVYGIDSESQQIFQEFATQGQSFFNSSGDGGAWGKSGGIASPADDPYITIVGGTVLTTTNAGGGWSSETVWTGSGGGISTNYSIPTWQQGINMSASGGSTTNRNIPDVALTADNIYIVAVNGSTGLSAGTSASTPLWAGYTALINQLAVEGGQQSVGFLNPALYAVGKGAYETYQTRFHDIVTGNNTNSSSPGGFYAVPGYDLCTGWGTPEGLGLMDGLAHPDVLLILPPIGFNTAGGVGGPYGVSAEALTLTNTTAGTISWFSSSPASWLNISPTSGTIGPGQSVSVTASLTAAAYSLPLGASTNTVFFTNQMDSVVFPRTFTISVLAPPSIGTQPTNQILVAQQTAAFTVSATGGQPLTCQWFFNGTTLTNGGNISGSTAGTLTITNVSVANAGSYYIVVTNAAQQVTSSNAILTVVPYVSIYQQPMGEALPAGATAFLSVAAYGQEPLTYQWKLNGTNIPGATASSLSLTNVQTSQSGNYTAAIGNAYGNVVSSPALVTVVSASQLTATFDTLSSSWAPVPDGYDGFNWTNFFIDAGNPIGMVSSPNVAVNVDTTKASTISRSSPFNLISCYVTASYYTNQEVEAKGYYNGMLVYDLTNDLSDTTPAQFQFDYYGITEVDFIPYINGTPWFGFFQMDNVVFVEGTGSSSPTPTGSLEVFIKPATAISSGALWQVDGGLPEASGATISGLTATNHTVSFLPARGWTRPAYQTVAVGANQTTAAMGMYILPAPLFFQAGSLRWNTNGFQVSVSNASGFAAIVQSSTNLQSWQNIFTNTGSFLFTDPSAPHFNQQYYRVLIP